MNLDYAIFRSQPIMTINDLVGIASHNKRENQSYKSNQDIKKELSSNNMEIVLLTEKNVRGFYNKTIDYKKEFEERMKTEREDRKRTFREMLDKSKNVVADELLFTATNTFFKDMTREDIKVWVDTCMDFVYNDLGYTKDQILHTTVFGPDDRLVQTQIRTFDMDKVASFGLTAYWDEQKGKARDVMQDDLKQKFQFFKSLTEINSMFGDNQQFVNQVKTELFADKVYVYTTKGDIIELPKGATPIDFAYKIHTDIGNTMVGVFVNDEFVPIDYVLHNKDRVRIVTDELSYGPRIDWIDKAQTSLAKRKIKEFSKK